MPSSSIALRELVHLQGRVEELVVAHVMLAGLRVAMAGLASTIFMRSS